MSILSLDRTDVPSDKKSIFETYINNYKMTFYTDLAARPPVHLGKEGQACRFCGPREESQRPWREAHAVSKALGNERLLSRYECSSCNERFGLWENDLTQMLAGHLALGQIPRRGGHRTISSPGQRSRFKDGAVRPSIEQYSDEQFFSHDPMAQTITMRFKTQSYRPLAVYKSLAKIGLSLVGEEDVKNFSALKRWLGHKDLMTDRVYADGSHTCILSTIPGWLAYPQPFAALLLRKTDISLPYCILILAFGNITLQIYPPCPKRDHAWSRQAITLQKVPLLCDLQPHLIEGEIKDYFVDLSSPEKTCRDDVVEIKYGNIIPDEANEC